MADWESEDFEPQIPAKNAVVSDKWEGEDEDDDVKDAWDAESEEEDSEKKDGDSEASGKAVQRKKKKKLADIIAEKEEAKSREMEDMMKEKQEMELLNTPEAKLAEKIRLQKLEESNQLELAKEMLGVSDDTSGLNFKPSSKEDFEKLSSQLVEKLRVLESSEHFQLLGDSLIAGLCPSLTTQTLKKVKGSVEGMISAKLKEEKAAKAKGGKGGKAKASIKMETDRSMFGRGLDDGFDDMDDFM